MILVFTTSVSSAAEARRLAPGLDLLAGSGQWNFDLTDCDCILRVKSRTDSERVIQLLTACGFRCDELEDLIPGELSPSRRLIA